MTRHDTTGTLEGTEDGGGGGEMRGSVGSREGRVGGLRVTMIETNWFSTGTAQRIYREYLELDVSGRF